jgi:fermentation-respiration switch protein FrsA (DUF1100 family)
MDMEGNGVMIHLINEEINDIPILHVVQGDRHHEALPTVIYYHGFNGEKISSLTLAYKIAEKGFRVILPDSMYHGQRQKGLTQQELDIAFWDIVMENIKELPELKQHLVEKGYSLSHRIGIGGTSMGAITAYGALCTYDWLKVAVSLMGTAYLVDYARTLIDYYNEHNTPHIQEHEAKEVLALLKTFDLTLHPKKLANRPLLMWHGEEDQVVPYAYSPAFFELAKPMYENEAAIRFVSEKERTHQISKLSMVETANWFKQFL